MNSLALHATKVRAVLVAGVAAFLLCLPVFGQSNLGSISGSITDKTGEVIANATVTVTDTQRGISRALTTDDAGAYVAPNLLPGIYLVSAEAPGFQKIERQNIRLEVAKDIRVDLTLQPGAQTTTVTVTEELPLVETTNSTLGGTLSNETINDLPLNGRNYQNLVVLKGQFRAEFFNILNHPNFANPYGGSNGFGENDPSSSANFGCGCATPDQAAGNPVLGTGGNRAIQLGLKLIF